MNRPLLLAPLSAVAGTQSSAAENGLGILPVKHVPGSLTATSSCDPSSVWLWLPRTGHTVGAPVNAEAGGPHCRLAGSRGQFGVLSRSAVGGTQNVKPCELSSGFSAVRPSSHSTHRINGIIESETSSSSGDRQPHTAFHMLNFPPRQRTSCTGTRPVSSAGSAPNTRRTVCRKCPAFRKLRTAMFLREFYVLFIFLK